MLVNKLLKRISNLEFEVEKLEKNEQYKYINGQAYFRQDYVLGREKEIDRLNNIINETKDYLEYQISQLDFYADTKALIIGSMAIVLLKGEDKE